MAGHPDQRRAAQAPTPRAKIAALSALSGALLLLACQPKVQLEAPKEPITINLNVKIEHEIRVKVDKDLENLFESEEGLF